MRFKEFEGEWVEKIIGEVLTVGSGKDYKHLERGNIPVFGTGGYMTSVNSYLYSGETVCIGRKGTINKPFYFNGKFWTVDTLFYTHSYQGILPKFLFPVFERIDWLKYNEASGVPSLSKSTIEKIPISVPNESEQKKIAALLFLIDYRIRTQRKIIEQLETLSKGLREKLFSQQLRFKDDNGKEFPNWEEKRMSDVYSIKTTNSFSRNDLNYENGEAKNIHYGDIHTKFQSHFKIENEIVPFVNTGINLEKINEEHYCKEGDILFADASEDLNDVGKSIEIVSLKNQKVLSGLHTILARPDLEKIAIGFGGHFFKSENIRRQIQTQAQGTKVASISPTRLQRITFLLPCKKEQDILSMFLSTIAEKIKTEIELFQQYECQKKHLLQNMFI